MEKSLFVAGLDFSLTNEDLKNMFSEFGTVESAKIITDKYNGQSRGFGFVEMSTKDQAKLCIEGLNNSTKKNNNRPLVVKFKEDKPANNRQSGGYSQRW